MLTRRCPCSAGTPPRYLKPLTRRWLSRAYRPPQMQARLYQKCVRDGSKHFKQHTAAGGFEVRMAKRLGKTIDDIIATLIDAQQQRPRWMASCWTRLPTSRHRVVVVLERPAGRRLLGEKVTAFAARIPLIRKQRHCAALNFGASKAHHPSKCPCRA